MRGTVFFLHPVSPTVNDVSGALEYGDRSCYVTSDYVFPDQIENEQMPHNVTVLMQEAADRFDPETDYLTIVGDHLQLVAFSGLLMQRHGRFRALRWDRDARGYLPVWVFGYEPDRLRKLQAHPHRVSA